MFYFRKPLQRLMNKKKLDQVSLVKESGISQGVITKLMNKRGCTSINLVSLHTLCDHLDTEVWKLVRSATKEDRGMSKFTNERWYTGPKDAPAYVQMSSIEGPQGGFRITRSDNRDHEFANLISAAPKLYEALRYLRDHMDFLKGDDYELAVKADKALAKADGKGE